MENQLRHLRHLAEWCNDWCNPVVFALYREDAEECAARLRDARTALAGSRMSRDDSLALELQLYFLEFQVACNLTADAASKQRAWKDMLQHLQGETAGEVSALFQACLLLIVSVLGDVRGHMALSETELDEVFARIPAADLDAELWYYVALWAVEHCNRRYITLAYGEMLTEPRGYLRHDIWLRVNLIYLLLEGRAQERDIIETLKVFTHYNQLRRFDEFIWPLILESGMDTPAILQAIAGKREELGNKPLEPPKF